MSKISEFFGMIFWIGFGMFVGLPFGLFALVQSTFSVETFLIATGAYACLYALLVYGRILNTDPR